jgi:hypothetical protein
MNIIAYSCISLNIITSDFQRPSRLPESRSFARRHLSLHDERLLVDLGVSLP